MVLSNFTPNFMTGLSQTNTIYRLLDEERLHYTLGMQISWWDWAKQTQWLYTLQGEERLHCTLGMQAGKCHSVQSFRYSVSFACQKSWNVLEQICKVHSSKVCTQLLLFSPACYGHGLHSIILNRWVKWTQTPPNPISCVNCTETVCHLLFNILSAAYGHLKTNKRCVKSFALA